MRGELVYTGDDFQSRPVTKNCSIWEAFGYGGPLALPPEDLQELTAWLSQAPLYVEELEWPKDWAGGLVEIDNEGE